MKRSSRRISLCLVAQFRDSRDTLQYQEAGRQDRVILWITRTEHKELSGVTEAKQATCTPEVGTHPKILLHKGTVISFFSVYL